MDHMELTRLKDFYAGRRVFVTGHTGFKGTWLCALLLQLGAEVAGYSHRRYDFFDQCGFGDHLRTHIADVRDFDALARALEESGAEIILHMAAQPLVTESYRDPAETYSVNLMGTVGVMEAVRRSKRVRAVVNVTTDKVYRNREWAYGYRENDELGGFDPYSNSKACSDLITQSYRDSFFAPRGIAVAAARAGNVIGGGDWAEDRLLPDCVRAAREGSPIVVRNPYSIRPWQHVLEPLYGYLLLAWALYEGKTDCTAFNFGPADADCVPAGEFAALFCEAWGEGVRWEARAREGAPHEARFLKLDCSLAGSELGWRPRWGIRQAITESVAWYKASGKDAEAFILMNSQIEYYFSQHNG